MNDTRHYLLDTDMCIYLLNGHPRVKARVAQVGIAALAVANRLSAEACATEVAIGEVVAQKGL